MLDDVKISNLSKIINFKLLKKEILDYIEKHDSNGKEFAISNRGGYQSNNLKLDSEIILQEYQTINSLVSYLGVDEYWINVNKRGHFNMPHDHGSTEDTSGCVYVDVENGSGGEIVFFKEKVEFSKFEKMILRGIENTEDYIVPEIGMSLIFPSDLKHAVLPHWAEQPRISIAYNIINKNAY